MAFSVLKGLKIDILKYYISSGLYLNNQNNGLFGSGILKNNVLLVANWESDVGYAWWLMENFWVQISSLSDNSDKRCYLIYPVLSKLPESISSSSIICNELNYNDTSLKGTLRLLRFIVDNSIDCIYLTDQPYFDTRYIFLRLCGVRRIIVHDHTPGERDLPRSVKKYLKKMLNSLPTITADAVIAVTSYVKDRHVFSNCIPSKRIHIAKNGIDPIGRDSENKNYVNVEFKIPIDAKVVFTSGRANVYKGIDFIIECANVIVNKKKMNDIYFLYCGDGPDILSFKAMCAKYGLNHRFIFAGARADVRQIVQSCHIGIQSSKGEVGYSLSILEYMSAGLATIVPDNPSVCGSIIDGENGLVYKQGNIDSACEALVSVIHRDSLRLKLSLNAQRTVEANYNLKNTNRSLVSILNDLYFSKDG